MKNASNHLFQRAGSAVALALVFLSANATAAGMLPETSLVIVNEADGEGTIKVKNTDDKVALLYVNIENIPEDAEPLLVVTPPVSRVESQESQLVRFIFSGKEALKTQRLKRVTFEGIPHKEASDGTSRVGFTVSQNLPALIHPKGLAMNGEPWKLLTWETKDGKLVVKNPSPYVVRLAESVTLLPEQKSVALGRAYILPGDEKVVVEEFNPETVNTVRLYPATIYGYQVEHYDVPLTI